MSCDPLEFDRDDLVKRIREAAIHLEECAEALRDAAARYRNVRKNLTGWCDELQKRCDHLTKIENDPVHGDGKPRFSLRPAE